jgi:hypothetical protein
MVSVINGDMPLVISTGQEVSGSPVMVEVFGEIYRRCMNSRLRHMDTTNSLILLFLIAAYARLSKLV